MYIGEKKRSFMKTSLIHVMALSVALGLGNLILTGCGENKSDKLEVNNWNCRNEISSNLVRRLERLETEGKIVDASLFIKKCQEQQLGFFSEEYKNLSGSQDEYGKNLKALLYKWKKEAGIS